MLHIKAINIFTVCLVLASFYIGYCVYDAAKEGVVQEILSVEVHDYDDKIVHTPKVGEIFEVKRRNHIQVTYRTTRLRTGRNYQERILIEPNRSTRVLNEHVIWGYKGESYDYVVDYGLPHTVSNGCYHSVRIKSNIATPYNPITWVYPILYYSPLVSFCVVPDEK